MRLRGGQNDPILYVLACHFTRILSTHAEAKLGKPAIEPSASSYQRLEWLDYLKGVGIVLVVVGHVYTYTFAAKVIFLFHMPLFFMISGYTHQAQPPGLLLKKTSLGLALPYLAYLLVLSADDIHRILTAGSQGSLGDSLLAVVNLLWRRGYGGVTLVKEFGVFWFVSVLYIGLNLLNLLLIATANQRNWLIVAMLLCATLAIADDLLVQPNAFPLNLNVVPAALFFLVAGVLGRQKLTTSSNILLVSSAMICALSVYLLTVEPREMQLVMKKANYGLSGTGLPIAIAWVYCLFDLARRFTSGQIMNGLFIQLGSASLVIMFLHQGVHFFLVDHVDALSRALIVAVALIFSYGFYVLMRGVPLLSRLFVGR